jgi:AraC-like DNA-binding protein
MVGQPWPPVLHGTAVGGDTRGVDPRPGYREIPPPPALAEALRCFWVRVVGDAGAGGPVLPDACSDLIWQAGRGAFVAGPDTGPAPAALRPGTVLVGARFAPGAGGAAFGLPLSELRDARAPAEEVRPGLGDRLAGDLEPAAAAAAIAEVAGELARKGGVDRAMAAAAALLAAPGTRVEALPERLGLSERQLRRRAHAAVGYGPKTLQRVLRFTEFLRLADAAPGEPDLARLGLEAGYADQSHLTNEVRRLAGAPPGRLLRHRRAA